MNTLSTTVLAPPAKGPLVQGPVPTFSVLIPAYQAANTIGKALSSALAQTAPPLEVIVCDDGSTDGLEAALEPYRDRIVLLRQENAGAAAARNHGLRAASGDFVISLDSDDVWLPGRLAALGNLAATRPDLDLLSTDVFFEVEGEIVGRFYEENAFDVGNQRVAILLTCFVGWPAARRERLVSVGGFDESLAVASDWEAWVRLILDGASAGLVPEPLMRYRVRPGSLSADRALSLRARVAVLDKAARNKSLRPDEHRFLLAARRSARTRAAQAAVAEAREAMSERRAGARRRALSLVVEPGVPRRARVAGVAAALHPSLGVRLLTPMESPEPMRDERAPTQRAPEVRP